MKLIAQHRINAVELDLKDESGVVGFTGVAARQRDGAAKTDLQPRRGRPTAPALGVRVIGRLVCFSDPLAATAAWATGSATR